MTRAADAGRLAPVAGHPVTRWWAERVARAGPGASDLSDADVAGATLADAVAEGLVELPLPGSGDTAGRWSALAAFAAADVTLAKLVEAHADAVAILAELGGPSPARGSLWAVWAAVTPALTARLGTDGRWSLSGTKPWASGSGCCTRALVTAATPDGERLFAIEVTDPRLRARVGSWPALAMSGTASRTLDLAGVPAEPVGGPGDYVGRPGFGHGGAGIAACWYGGAVGIAGALLTRVAAGGVDPYRLAHLGAVHASLTATRAALAQAADRVDAAPGERIDRVAGTVRALAERGAGEVIDRVGRALGPGPLATDRAHARRVADLTLFVRQSHAEHDLAALGADLASTGTTDPGW